MKDHLQGRKKPDVHRKSKENGKNQNGSTTVERCDKVDHQPPADQTSQHSHEYHLKVIPIGPETPAVVGDQLKKRTGTALEDGSPDISSSLPIKKRKSLLFTDPSSSAPESDDSSTTVVNENFQADPRNNSIKVVASDAAAAAGDDTNKVSLKFVIRLSFVKAGDEEIKQYTLVNEKKKACFLNKWVTTVKQRSMIPIRRARTDFISPEFSDNAKEIKDDERSLATTEYYMQDMKDQESEEEVQYNDDGSEDDGDDDDDDDDDEWSPSMTMSTNADEDSEEEITSTKVTNTKVGLSEVEEEEEFEENATTGDDQESLTGADNRVEGEEAVKRRNQLLPERPWLHRFAMERAACLLAGRRIGMMSPRNRRTKFRSLKDILDRLNSSIYDQDNNNHYLLS